MLNNQVKIVFEKGDIVDIIDFFRYILTLISCGIIAYAYNKEHLSSIRGAISDTISFSSIVLGILGLLIGMLMSMKEDSIFFKKAKQFDLDNLIYDKLLKRIRSAFLFNLILVVLSIFYCFILPNMPIVAKAVGAFLWFYLFIIVSWDIFYLIWLIIKICLFKDNESSGRPTAT